MITSHFQQPSPPSPVSGTVQSLDTAPDRLVISLTFPNGTIAGYGTDKISVYFPRSSAPEWLDVLRHLVDELETQAPIDLIPATDPSSGRVLAYKRAKA